MVLYTILMAINSRNKGAKNERKLAKLIETWSGKSFSRTPASGGLQWKASFSKGDIICTTEGHYFPFCIEAKNHKEIDFSHLLNDKIKLPKIFEFWNQCTRDATKANKIPLLFMRYDGMPSDLHFIAMPIAFFRVIKDLPIFVKRLEFHNPGPNRFIIMASGDFFKFNYKELRLTAKKYLKNGKEKKGAS